MFRRSRSRRALAALTSAWFVLFSLAPTSLHPCPMHGAGDVAPVSVPMEMPADAAPGHAHHAPTDPSPSPAHPCECDTTCCVAPVMLRSVAASLPIAGDVQVIGSALPAMAQPHAPTRDRLLPFANGPPESTGG